VAGGNKKKVSFKPEDCQRLHHDQGHAKPALAVAGKIPRGQETKVSPTQPTPDGDGGEDQL